MNLSFLLFAACGFILFGACSNVISGAEGKRKYELNTASDVKDVLKENIGKKLVHIKLGSGEELAGGIEKDSN